MGLLSIAIVLTSCSKDESNSVDTSKAIRNGNFLQAADFKDVSKLNIHNSDNYVTQKISDGIAKFKYSQPETRTNDSNYKEQTTEIKLNEDIFVEMEEGEYLLEFSYLFELDNQSEIKSAIQNVNMLLHFAEINPIDDDVIPIPEPRVIKLGSGGDVPMNDKWSTYRTTIYIRTGVSAWQDKHPNIYANINFELRNISKRNNNTFHIRNIQLVKK